MFSLSLAVAIYNFANQACLGNTIRLPLSELPYNVCFGITSVIVIEGVNGNPKSL